MQRLHLLKPDAGLKSELVGHDGRKLCAASGLSDSSLYDVVNPYFMLFRNNILEPVLSRTGSKCLGNSFYSKLSFYDICLESEKIKDALGKFSPLNEANYSRSPVDFEQQAEAAYQLLQGENPYSIVIEGAGPFLPFWRKKIPQPVNHVLAILRGRIFLVKNANMHICNSGSGLVGIQGLFRAGKISLQNAKSLPIQRAAQDQVVTATDVLISKLMN